MKTFELNGTTYHSDEETVRTLESVVQGYRDSGMKDASAVVAMIELGLATGRIQEAK